MDLSRVDSFYRDLNRPIPRTRRKVDLTVPMVKAASISSQAYDRIADHLVRMPVSTTRKFETIEIFAVMQSVADGHC